MVLSIFLMLPKLVLIKLLDKYRNKCMGDPSTEKTNKSLFTLECISRGRRSCREGRPLKDHTRITYSNDFALMLDTSVIIHSIYLLIRNQYV